MYPNLRMMCYSVLTQAYSEKEIPSSPNRSRTYDLPIATSSDAQTRFLTMTYWSSGNTPGLQNRTSHMIQNPPYHKEIPTCQARFSFIFVVPVEDATFFCHPVWRILYHATSLCKRPIVHNNTCNSLTLKKFIFDCNNTVHGINTIKPCENQRRKNENFCFYC